MTTWRRRKHEKRDLHFLNANGMVACNPRDREAAHRAEVEHIATENVPLLAALMEGEKEVRVVSGGGL